MSAAAAVAHRTLCPVPPLTDFGGHAEFSGHVVSLGDTASALALLAVQTLVVPAVRLGYFMVEYNKHYYHLSLSLVDGPLHLRSWSMAVGQYVL